MATKEAPAAEDRGTFRTSLCFQSTLQMYLLLSIKYHKTTENMYKLQRNITESRILLELLQ